jgi:peptidoglycan/LPS O-acetylase OafA/YrhL
LRGVAILLVLLFHIDRVIAGPRAAQSGVVVSPWWAFIQAGHTGVSLFFILSAFLLSLPFLREAAGGERVSRRDYYARRALRILPLYYTAVAVGSVFTAHAVGDLVHGLPYLAFLNSFAGLVTSLFPFSSVWWSLATEVQFYLLLPLLPFVLQSRLGRCVGVAVCIAYIIAYVAFQRSSMGLTTIEGRLLLAQSVFGRAPLFGLGMLAAWTYWRAGEGIARRLASVKWIRNGGSDVLLLIAVVALGFLLRVVVFGGLWEWEVQLSALHLAEGVLWTIVLLLLLLAPLRSKPLFANRLLSEIGLLSYSIYLIHFPLIYVVVNALRDRQPNSLVGWSAPSLGVAAVVTAVCFGLAAVTYRLIERPFLIRKAQIDR